MTSAPQTSISPPPNRVDPNPQSGSAGPPSAAATSPPLNSVGQPASQVNATSKTLSPPPVLGLAASQHAPRDPVNGRGVPTMAAPPIVNSNNMANPAGSPGGDHSRKSSVTISAAGASGSLPNGGPAAPAPRANLSFGAFPAGGGSPAVAHSTPYNPQSSSSLPPPASNPRITSPAASPSPIPQPAASGGRPPSGFQGQGVSFGSMPGGDQDSAMRGNAQQPMMPGQQPIHLRRESSQSSDMGLSSSPYGPSSGRGGYMGGGGRGRGGYGQGYPNQMPYNSPAQGYRGMPNQPRPGGNVPHHFQNQMGPHTGSPHPPPRSPALSGSHPNTPPVQQPPMPNNQQMQYGPGPSYGQFHQHLAPQQNQFNMQPPYDPQYGYYGAPPYGVPPQFLQQQPPGSPRGLRQQMPPQQQHQYGPGPYNQGPAQNMSRTSSQMSERPASSLGQGQQPPPPPMTPGSTQRAQTPSQSGTPAPPAQNNFQIPSKQKKGIVIKNAQGDVVTFDNKKPSTSSTPSAPAPAPVKAPSPAPSSSAVTPPESTTSHVRSESKTGKTAEEIRADFMQQVNKSQGGDKQIKEEDDKTAAEVAIETKAEEKAEEVAAAAEEKAEAEVSAEKAIENAEAKDEPPARDIASIEPVEETKIEAEKPSESQKADSVDATAVKDEAATEASTTTDADEEARLKEEEMERMIAEMEAADREEEERERAFAEKKKKEAEEKAAREKEAAANTDEEMRRLEREAEAAEEAREAKNAEQQEDTAESKAEREDLFASLKKPALGPGAETPSGTETPVSVSDDQGAMPPPSGTQSPKPSTPVSAKSKPAALKLDTAKPVEPAQPTAGMQSLKSARILQLQNETVKYPEGIKSPNPAINPGSRRGGRLYDKDFLIQFQNVFSEKPTVEWEQKLKETVGDATDSAAPKSARTPSGMGGRQPSRNPPQTAYQGMGNFGQAGRPMGPGAGGPQPGFDSRNKPMGPTMSNPLANFAGRPGGAFPMGGPMPVQMGRTPSVQNMAGHPSRAGTSARGSKPGSKRGDERVPSRKEQEAANKAMPLTAGSDLKPLEQSTVGWKSASAGRQSAVPVADPSGHIPPDMVQRKVKGALNKMTPERFEKIADQILTIAAQSKDESDGRTLRQVIALTFEKACDEAHWASMYAKFCYRMLQDMSPDIKDENVRNRDGDPVVGGTLFRKYLLNRCQEEFERGWDVNLPEKAEGQSEETAMMSDEYYLAAAAKRRGLGLVQFIGELYKLGMLSIKIMHACFLKLLDFDGMPDESAIESVVKLLRTVGSTMESRDNGKAFIDTYFDRIEKTMHIPGLPSRMYFMLLDTMDLRKAGWHSKDDSKGPKTIQEIRDEAAVQQQQAELEKQRQNQRGGRLQQGRGDARNLPGGPMAPPDYQKDQIRTDDLRKLSMKNQGGPRQPSSGPTRSMGPTSMFPSRSSSGRQGLGPNTSLLSRGDDSSPGSSRTGSQRGEKKEDNKTGNAFSALAGLDASGESGTGGGSTSVTPASSPPVTKAQPVASLSEEAVKPESSADAATPAEGTSEGA